MKTCLIVDDSRVVRKIARKIMEDLGLSCEEAEDGQEAFEACMIKMPEIVLLDWNMPVMSGIDFLRKLRQVPNGNFPKVVFCTTENDFSFIQEALEAGASEYIMKPFDSEIIESKLTQIGVL